MRMRSDHFFPHTLISSLISPACAIAGTRPQTERQTLQPRNYLANADNAADKKMLRQLPQSLCSGNGHYIDDRLVAAMSALAVARNLAFCFYLSGGLYARSRVRKDQDMPTNVCDLPQRRNEPAESPTGLILTSSTHLLLLWRLGSPPRRRAPTRWHLSMRPSTEHHHKLHPPLPWPR